MVLTAYDQLTERSQATLTTMREQRGALHKGLIGPKVITELTEGGWIELLEEDARFYRLTLRAQVYFSWGG